MDLYNKMFVVETYSDGYNDVVEGEYYYAIVEGYDETTGEPTYSVYPTRWIEEISNNLTQEPPMQYRVWTHEDHPVVTSTVDTVTYVSNLTKDSYDAPTTHTFNVADQVPASLVDCVVHAFNMFAQNQFSFGNYNVFIKDKAELVDSCVMPLTKVEETEVMFEPDYVMFGIEGESLSTEMRIMPMPAQAQISGVKVKNLTPDIADFDMETRMVTFKKVGKAQFHITSELGGINCQAEVHSVIPAEDATYSFPERATVGNPVLVRPTYTPSTATFIGQYVDILIGGDICSYNPDTCQLTFTGSGTVQGNVYDKLTGVTGQFAIQVEDPDYIPIESIEIENVSTTGYGIRNAVKMRITVLPENATDKDNLIVFSTPGMVYDKETQEAYLKFYLSVVPTADGTLTVVDLKSGISVEGKLTLDGVPLQEIKIEDMGIPKGRHVPLKITYIPEDAVKPQFTSVTNGFVVNEEDMTIAYTGKEPAGTNLRYNTVLFENEESVIFNAQISDDLGDINYAYDVKSNDPGSITLKVGETVPFPVTYVPSTATHVGGEFTMGQDGRFSYDDYAGTITGWIDSTGSVYYVPRNSSRRITRTVTIQQYPDSVELLDIPSFIGTGSMVKIGHKILPETSSTPISVSVADPTIGKAYYSNSQGIRFEGLKAGKTTLTVKTTWGGLTDTKEVEVTQLATGIDIGATAFEMEGDTSTVRTATGVPAGAYAGDIYLTGWKAHPNLDIKRNDDKVSFTFTSKNTTTLTAPVAIPVELSAPDVDCTTKFTVTVKPKTEIVPTSITLDKSEVTVYMRDIDAPTVKATVLPADAVDKTVTWTLTGSGDASLKSYKGDTANFTTPVSCHEKTAREMTLTATTSNGLTATCVVKQPYIPVDSIKLTCPDYDETVYVSQGESKFITLEATPANASNVGASWVSSNPEQVSLSQYSDVTYEAIANVFDGYGWAEITATSNDNNTISATIGVETTPLEV